MKSKCIPKDDAEVGADPHAFHSKTLEDGMQSI
jgi:hypothetical protein